MDMYIMSTIKKHSCQIYISARFKHRILSFICHSLSSSFQNRFRPTYKIAFKTVTELEWRCCPGYHGLDCRDLKPPPHRQAVPGIQPYPVPNPGYTTRHTQSKTLPTAFKHTSVSWLSASPLLRAYLGSGVDAHTRREPDIRIVA